MCVLFIGRKLSHLLVKHCVVCGRTLVRQEMDIQIHHQVVEVGSVRRSSSLPPVLARQTQPVDTTCHKRWRITTYTLILCTQHRTRLSIQQHTTSRRSWHTNSEPVSSDKWWADIISPTILKQVEGQPGITDTPNKRVDHRLKKELKFFTIWRSFLMFREKYIVYLF